MYLEVPVSRIQLALNVANIEESIEFYSKLFSTLPHKRRDGYANFVIEEPNLKLVLIENAAEAGTLNHLGVELTPRTRSTPPPDISPRPGSTPLRN